LDPGEFDLILALSSDRGPDHLPKEECGPFQTTVRNALHIVDWLRKRFPEEKRLQQLSVSSS
jgi:hypothetical protein